MSTIAAVDFTASAAFPGLTTAMGTMDDGSSVPLFTFYDDELRFDAVELVGLTEAEARALHFQRDLEYLRS